MGEYTFSSRGPSELGENFEQIIKGNLGNRLMAAQKIHKKEQEPHTFMEGDELISSLKGDDVTTASVLNKLIKKYAFRY